MMSVHNECEGTKKRKAEFDAAPEKRFEFSRPHGDDATSFPKLTIRIDDDAMARCTSTAM